MNYLTSVMLSGIIYNIILSGASITVNSLKSKLRGWLLSEKELEILQNQVNSIENLDGLSAKAIAQKLDNNDRVQQIIQSAKYDNSVNTITQTHLGNGHIAGRDINITNDK